jgi:hypothetical protein
MWQQRAAEVGEHIVWDYHCVLIGETSAGAFEVFDLDSRLGLPTRLSDYLAHTFAPLPPEIAQHTPRFRVVPVDEFLSTFASDRSHMRSSTGGWVKPPPPWDAPGTTSNLKRFIDMHDNIAGEIFDVEGLRERFGPP